MDPKELTGGGPTKQGAPASAVQGEAGATDTLKVGATETPNADGKVLRFGDLDVMDKQFLLDAREFTGPDDPRWVAALQLSEIYEAAITSSFNLGRGIGFGEGRCAAEREAVASWSKLAKFVQETMAQPTFAELQRRRGEAS